MQSRTFFPEEMRPAPPSSSAMLTAAGVEVGDAVGGLTATALLQTGALLLLPVLALPAILLGLPIGRGLAHLAYLGLGVFVVYAGVAILLFETDEPLRVLGRVGQLARNRLLRHREPATDWPERLVAQRNSTRAALGTKWRQALLYAVGKVGLDFVCL